MEDIKKVLQVFPHIWESYDISSIIDTIEEGQWFSYIVSIKDFLKLLQEYDITIKFAISTKTVSFVEYLIEQKLEDNYPIKDELVLPKAIDKLLTDLALYHLSLNIDECTWSDFELAVIHSFDIEIVKLLESKLNKNNVLHESILIHYAIKERTDKKLVRKIKENPIAYVYLKLTNICLKNNNTETYEYLKKSSFNVEDKAIQEFINKE